MSTRNAIVLLAILIHMVAFFWSCYQPKHFRSVEELQAENPRFIQAELEKNANQQYIVKWETSPKGIGVDVSISENEQSFSTEDQIGTSVRFNEFVYKNPEQRALFFKLVAGGSDVVILSDDKSCYE